MFNTEGNGQAPIAQDFRQHATGGEMPYGFNRAMASLDRGAPADQKARALRTIQLGAGTQAPGLRGHISQARRDILPLQLQRITDLLSQLSDHEAPGIGQAIASRWHTQPPKIILDPTIPHRAYYVGYSFLPQNRGLAREFRLREGLIEDVFQATSSLVHEAIHDHQVDTDTSQYSPYNPDTKIIIHPLDWIMFATLLERDAHAKEAFFNAMLGKIAPAVYENTERDLVTVREFESLRAASTNLQEALSKAAAVSLEKSQCSFDPYGPNFVDHYVELAIHYYKKSMEDRKHEGQTGDYIYVRLSARDFWEIGNYGIGPNTLGEHGLDPRFAWRPRMSERNGAALKSLCAAYAIPCHECCPALDEVLQSPANAPSPVSQPYTQRRNTAQTPAPNAPALSFSF